MSSVLVCGRVPGRLGRAARCVLAGVWLGLLSDRGLRALDERYYDRDATYRTAGWNERGLSWWEREAVGSSFAGGARIVVPACGGGREVLALLSSGFDAVGYESHPRLAAYAERFLAGHGHPDRALAAERDRFPDAGSCDGVLVGWGAYSLICPRRRRIAFLRDAAAATGPGGPVIVSCFELIGGGRELRVCARIANRLRRLRGAPPVEPGDVLAPNRVHVFTRPELELELREAGLVPVHVRTVQAADPAAGYVCAVARSELWRPSEYGPGAGGVDRPPPRPGGGR